MFKFKEGQTYICKKAARPWWTRGTSYEVVRNKYGELCFVDDDGAQWTIQYLKNSDTKFKLKETETTDLIDNQAHYKNQGIEPIVLMKNNFTKEEYTGFLQGNVLKYMLRYKDKNGVEDLKKAKTYLTWLIDELDDDGVRRSVS